MISDNVWDNHHSSYILQDEVLSEFIQISNIGKEVLRLPASLAYVCNGLTRPDTNIYIFKYTLSGRGTIRIGKTVNHLYPGHAFLVSVPSDHEYYLGADNKEWEFVFITLQGEWARQIFQRVISGIGNILTIDRHSRLIQLLEDIYERVKKRNVKDTFDASSLAYAFVMELYKLASDVVPKGYPKLVSIAIEIINDDYKRLGSIEELAVMLNVSKAHLMRVFSRHVGISPGKFLVKTRLKHAEDMLLNSGSSLDEIAEAVGFANGNYLGKVLRQHLGVTTERYRRLQSITS